MEISKTTIVIAAVLVIALFFFVLAIAGDSGTTGQAVSNAGQFVGGGCGR